MSTTRMVPSGFAKLCFRLLKYFSSICLMMLVVSSGPALEVVLWRSTRMGFLLRISRSLILSRSSMTWARSSSWLNCRETGERWLGFRVHRRPFQFLDVLPGPCFRQGRLAAGFPSEGFRWGKYIELPKPKKVQYLLLDNGLKVGLFWRMQKTYP